MRLQLTTKQLMSANKLLEEIKDFVNRGYGTVNKILVLRYSLMPNTIIIKYDKLYVMGGEYEYEYPIATIDQSGKIEFIENNFKDVFQRSAFLSECVPFDLEDRNEYQIID